MPLSKDAVVIGLTGAFGSGCTTASKHLRDQGSFTRITLSDVIRAEWARKHPRKNPSRLDLQRFGDELRQTRGAEVLVDLALQPVIDEESTVTRIVVDSIRNTQEIERLISLFGYRFLLFAILASPQDRCERV